MVFNATLNNSSAKSCRSVLLVEEIGENRRSVASHTSVEKRIPDILNIRQGILTPTFVMLRQKCICVGVKAYFFSSRFGKGHIDKTKGGILVDWGKKERKKERFQIRIYLASYSDVGVRIPCLMFSISGILFSTDVWLATDRRFSPISSTVLSICPFPNLEEKKYALTPTQIHFCRSITKGVGL
jgi:hypothetical protein